MVRFANKYNDNYQINQNVGGVWDATTSSWVGGDWGGNAKGLLEETGASEWVGPQCAEDDLMIALQAYGTSGVMESESATSYTA